MKLLKGKKISEKILKGLKIRIKKEKTKPGLAVILIGKNPASDIYVRLKEKAARRVGIKFFLYRFPERSREAEIIKKIKKLNADKKISGIIVQLPLPKKFHTQMIINAIDPKKDADGFHPGNLKSFLKNKDGVYPVLPKAILKFLKGTFRKEVRVAIIANSKKFGEIMVLALKQEGIRGQHILYKNYKKSLPVFRRTDILITAVGKPKFIKGEMIKKGAIIIDGGITKSGKKVLGDVDSSSVKNKASYLTPVPGGVGPVTIACLLENVYLLSKKSR